MKVLLHYRASPGLLRLLDERTPPGIDVRVVPETDRERFARELRDTTVLLHFLEPVTREVLEAASQLRLVQKVGVGLNTIDLEAARERGVAVANMPGTNTPAVAEHALALLLALLRRLRDYDAATRTGRGWSDAPEHLALVDASGEIHGRCVGLVGFGAVARHLAPVLEALGAELLYTATAPKPDAAPARWRELDALLREADIVSLHVPLVPATRHLIDARRLAMMKPGSVLINTARGGLVDEPALLHALRHGPLRGAGLDVFADEPVDPASPLLGLPNVVLTPHVAWLTPETLERSLDRAFENCRRLERGEPLLHRAV